MPASDLPLALLLCVATSALTTLLVQFYVLSPTVSPKLAANGADSSVGSKEKQKIDAFAGSVKGSSTSKDEASAVQDDTKSSAVDLQTLEDDAVPQSLRLGAYFDLDRLRDFDHFKLFDGCSNVLAVLDQIHPYLINFFEDSSWMLAEKAQITTLLSSTRSDSDGRGVEEDSDEDSDDESPRRRSSVHLRSRWHLPEWLDPSETAEIMIYPGVRAESFAPQKIINLKEFDKPTRRPSTESNGVAKRHSFGWSRSSVSVEEEKVVEKKRLIVLPEALVMGGTFDLSEGSIYIGKQVRIEPNVFIKGPAIIGARSTLRSGTYIRGDVIVGRDVVLRGEIKNSVIMDDAELCHPGYCGDSICGFKSHFGNQVTTANLGLFAQGTLKLDVDGTIYDTGRKKAGVILGDGSQLGCSAVTDPCTLIQRQTVVYPLTRLPKGVNRSSLVIKNKPLEKGVLEVVPLQSSEQE